MENQQHREISIRELTSVEREAVIRALTTAIGAEDAFERMVHAHGVIDAETVNVLLSLPDWPPPDSSPIELAWLSAPIQGPETSRIARYSVFRSLTHDGFAVWICRTPHKPTNEDAYLRNDEVAVAVAETYGFFFSSEDRHRHNVAKAKRHLRTVLVPLLILQSRLV